MITIKRAAELTGVPEATLRIWERRYGIGAPSRSESGYRLYDAPAILAIKDMQRLIAEGWSPQQAAIEVRGRVVDVASAAQPNAPAGHELPGDVTDRFFAAIDALDGRQLSSVLDSAFSVASFEFVTDNWLVPTLRQLGERWAAGDVDIASEHFASHAIMRRLSAAFEGSSQSGSGPRVLIGAPSGSLHEIGTLAFATAVARRALRVVYLGADVPAESWVAAAQRHGADAVAISVVMPSDVAAAQLCVDALKRHCPQVAITVGGSAASAVRGSELVLTGGVGESADMLTRLLA